MTDAEFRAFLEDLNACGSDALEHLAHHRLADVRTNIQAILDNVREKLENLEPD